MTRWQWEARPQPSRFWSLASPLLALLVAANIVWTGWKLLRQSVSGLLDERLSDDDIDRVVAQEAQFVVTEAEVAQFLQQAAGARDHPEPPPAGQAPGEQLEHAGAARRAGWVSLV